MSFTYEASIYEASILVHTPPSAHSVQTARIKEEEKKFFLFYGNLLMKHLTG